MCRIEEMMEIYKPDIENREILNSYLKYNRYPSCELSASNNILWSDFYDTRFTVIEDMLVFCKMEQDKPAMMSFPFGKNNPKPAFDAIRKYFSDNKLAFKLYLVEDKAYEQIDNWYPGMYKVEYDRDDADYLYLRESLETLAGKKLHGKRNHINRFLENYPDYVYERINEDNRRDCLKIAYDWAKENNVEHSGDKNYEKCALRFALENMDKLGLTGALIRIGERAVAFTIGEPLTEDTFVVHFEKAYADIQGAYPMINREFVRRELQAYKYVNREEDMGIPGLRHAKTSYQPVKLIEKGIVTETCQ